MASRSAPVPRSRGVDDGEGGLAFAEVGGGGLAEDVFLRGEVEDVVDDLEGEAEVAARTRRAPVREGRSESSLSGLATTAPELAWRPLKRQAVLR